MNVILNRLSDVLDSTHVGIIVWIILTEFETKIKQVNHNFSKIVLPSLQFKCYVTFAKRKGIQLPFSRPWDCCRV
jgi:hypothetical protein